MPFETITILRLCGIAGILGALVTGFGDLLYNYVPGSKQTLYEKMSTFSQKRLVSAGTLGLVGSWLYFLSVFHLYFAFQPVGEGISLAIAITFAWVAIAYGVAHASYFAIGSNSKFARDNGLDIGAAGKAGEALFTRIVAITYIPVAITSLLMVYGVITGHSAYPIWMVLLLPIVPYLLRPMALKILRGRVRELIRDSYDNFVLLVYFLASTIVLWSM
jgi:hypothetical protein